MTTSELTLSDYAQRGIPLKASLTDNGREFYATEAHPSLRAVRGA
jgi:hypothetical protein